MQVEMIVRIHSLEIQVDMIVEIHSFEMQVEMIVGTRLYRCLYRDNVEYCHVETPVKIVTEHTILFTTSYRYCRNKPCRNILVLVIPLCIFTETLVNKVNPIVSSI